MWEEDEASAGLLRVGHSIRQGTSLYGCLSGVFAYVLSVCLHAELKRALSRTKISLLRCLLGKDVRGKEESIPDNLLRTDLSTKLQQFANCTLALGNVREKKTKTRRPRSFFCPLFFVSFRLFSFFRSFFSFSLRASRQLIFPLEVGWFESAAFLLWLGLHFFRVLLSFVILLSRSLPRVSL